MPVPAEDEGPTSRIAPGRAAVTADTSRRLRLELHLARDAASVGVARRVLDSALETIGVDPDCRFELVLAASEACTNVVRHAAGSSRYEMRVAVDLDACTVQVIDHGRGAEVPRVNGAVPDVTAEGGRGMYIMGMVSDNLHVRPRRPVGLEVRFSKRLSWA